MSFPVTQTAVRFLRILSIIVFAGLGTVALMRFAPGYFTDQGELDAAHAESARASVKTEEGLQGSILTLTKNLVYGWSHGDLGESRQYGVPVLELIKPRIKVTARLLATGIVSGWSLALILALPLGLRQDYRGEVAITLMTCTLLAIPVGAMATACLLSEKGGPLAVLTAVLAVRDFKLTYKLFRQTRQSTHLLYARAQGIPGHHIARLYVLRPLLRELLAIGMISLVTALGAVVPVEVIFDVPGLGQLAWAGAMNRDLPVLLGVTLLMATAVGFASSFAGSTRQLAAR